MIEDLGPSWQRVEARHFVALRAVARTGTFREAAAALGYSLSTLSAQVAALERLVGQVLVERPGGRRRVRLTAAGACVLDHADALGGALAALRDDLDALASDTTRLRLGVFQSVAARLLPAVLASLAEPAPGRAVDLVERGDDADLLALVAAGALDATFAVLPLTGPFAFTPLVDDPYVALVRAGDPLADAGAVEASTLLERPLIDYRDLRHAHHARARLPDGAGARIVARSDDNLTIHALVAAGIGVAVLPALGVDRRDDRVRAIPIAPSVRPRQIVLAWRRDAPPAGLAALADACRAAAAACRDCVPEVP